jgi:parvulin-like peptidyl-prolyl isomerase
MLIVRLGVRAAPAVAGLLLLSAGCAEKHNGGPVGRVDPTLARQQAATHDSVQPIDQSGPVVLNDAQVPQPKQAGPAANPIPDSISPTVGEAVKPIRGNDFDAGSTRNGGAAGAATAPAPAPPRNPGDAPETTGGYQLVGTVLAEVSDTPIFADKVLATVDKELAAQARRLDENAFRAKAADTIQRQIVEFIKTELEFALAMRELDKRDQELARMATIKWRDEQIVRAGGSLEVARQRAAAAGYDFEELQDEQYRLFMRRLYYERREYPKIQVTASDIRRYYQEHLQGEFTKPDRARFRVIKVDKQKTGGRQQALGEINRLLDRVRSGGKDFAELAAEDNDEESFKRPVDWFQRNSFVVKEVEDAAWKLQPGQITDVIETPDSFYIAKLDAKEPGHVRPFNEPDVQKEIELELKKRQFEALRSKRHQALIADSVIRYHPKMVELAVEMAMQKYHYWRQANAK